MTAAELCAALLDALPGRAVAVDRDGLVLHANQAWLGFMDRDAGAVLGQPLSAWVEAPAVAAAQPRLAGCFAGVPSEVIGWNHQSGPRRAYERRCFRPVRDGRGTVVAALILTEPMPPPADEAAATPRSVGQFDQTMLQAIIDAMPARAAVVDREHRYLTVNRLLLDYVRLPAEQVLGRTVPEVLGQASYEVMRAWEPRLLAGETVRFEGWVPYVHGEQRYVRQSVMPHVGPDGEVVAYISMSEDLTALRQREADVVDERAALRAAEAQSAAIIASALDGIIVIGEDGLVRAFNPAAEAMFGHNKASVMGRPIGDIIVPEHLRAAHAHGFQRYLSTGQARVLGRRVELEALHAEGHVFPIELALVEFHLGGQRLFAAHLRDLSEPRRAAAEIAAQRERIHQIEKLSAMGSLLAGVAHELNNPLAILLAQSTLLKEKAPDADVARRALRIEAAAERSGRIVKSFLAMARQKPAERVPMDLNAVLQGALEMTGYGLRSAGVVVELALSAELPAFAADRDLLGQVVANLIINAQQALQEKPHPRRLRLETRPEGAEAVLTVADNGPGVPEAVRTRIFEPYFTTKPAGAGTGIGLSICRRIIEEHGGSIEVGISAEGGAQFTIRLPLGAAAAIAPAPVASRGPRLDILIVDDEPDVAESLADILDSDGHATLVLADPKAAIALAGSRRFDAVFADLRMPVMDGMALRAALAETAPGIERRFVIMTGDTVAGPETLQRGGDPPLLLEKPFTPAEVRAVLARLPRDNGDTNAPPAAPD